MRHFPLNIDKLLEQLFKYSPREITFFNFSSEKRRTCHSTPIFIFKFNFRNAKLGVFRL